MQIGKVKLISIMINDVLYDLKFDG